MTFYNVNHWKTKSLGKLLRYIKDFSRFLTYFVCSKKDNDITL